MRRTTSFAAAFALTCSVIVGCSGQSGRTNGFIDGASSGGSAGDVGFGRGDAGSSTPPSACVPNRANYDIPGNGCDDDGDGTVDNPPACDDALAADGDAKDFARAMGICANAKDDSYGLVSAHFWRGHEVNDTPKREQHGILPKFGALIKPSEGVRLGVLSTGYAQEYDGGPNVPFGGVLNDGSLLVPTLYGHDWWGANTVVGNGKAPPGFPKAAAGCRQASAVNDVINLKLELKAPPNARGIKFDFNFFSSEWPAFICTEYNDGFIAYLTAKGFNGGQPDNISFDKDKNPVSVNNGFFDRCTPGVETGCAGARKRTSECPGGPGELAGTGFGIFGDWCANEPGGGRDESTNGGATGWLTSQAPVEPGETFTLELMIWDAGDGMLDSSVLLDHFTWIDGDVAPGTDRPPR